MKRQSIGRKLGVAVTFSVMLGCAVTSTISLREDVRQFIASKKESLIAVGSAFASAIARPMKDRDARGVFEVLRGIGHVPHIFEATARDVSGHVVMTAGSGARLDGDATLGGSQQPSLLQLLRSRSISIVVPILDAGQPAGERELLSTTDGLVGGLVSTALANILGGLVALGAGLVVVDRLRRSIIRPLSSLTDVMTVVQERHDYSANLPGSSLHELEILVGAFNSMLAEIRDRDGQLFRHRERLEQTVEDRTRDLAIAKQTAEEANASKSSFLATMSHEIRTPLSGLLVSAELLASTELPGRARRYAEIISRSGSTLLAIINDILDFSKIEAGKLTLETSKVDVRPLFDSVANLYYPRAREKGLDLAVLIAGATPNEILIDPNRVQQIVSNLVSNAIKFTESGYILIRVSAAHENTLDISVTDTGIGIPEDKLSAVFEAFTQAEATTARRFGGTGLGLSISSRLVEAMGGSLSVRSTYGAGSTFTCSFPLVQTSSAANVDALGTPPKGRALVFVRGGATRIALIETLQTCGYTVRMADDADAFREEDTNLIIADKDVATGLSQQFPNAQVLQLEEFGSASSSPDGEDASALHLPFISCKFADLISELGQSKPSRATRRASRDSAGPRYVQARILVVDDTAVNREIMFEALARFSIKADFACNGLEAIEAVENQPYDLVFMDGSMPELDGFEATRRIRTREAQGLRSRVPIIALTAHVVGAAAEAWREAGMDAVLYKPFTLADLDRSLAAWLAPSDLPRSDEETPDLPAMAMGMAPEDKMELFDSSVMDELTSVDRGSASGFLGRVLTLYRLHAPQAVEQARKAAIAGDDDGVASAAHALKSMSLNIGAQAVAKCAARVEAMARNQESYEPWLNRMSDIVHSTLLAIEQRHQEPSAGAFERRTMSEGMASLTMFSEGE